MYAGLQQAESFSSSIVSLMWSWIGWGAIENVCVVCLSSFLKDTILKKCFPVMGISADYCTNDDLRAGDRISMAK